MKFFTCCSNKIETQTVEPQVLPEQNDRRQASQTHNIEDTTFTPQSSNDVSVFGDFSGSQVQILRFSILHTQVYLNLRKCTGGYLFYPGKLVKEALITGINSLFYPDLRKLDFRA